MVVLVMIRKKLQYLIKNMTFSIKLFGNLLFNYHKGRIYFRLNRNFKWQIVKRKLERL